MDHPDATGLLQAFYGEQVRRYGFAESIDLDPDAFSEPDGAFLVVYDDARPVGCGGFRWYDQARSTAELKKTYLVSDVRGRRIGRMLLTRLESLAILRGAQRMILETGVHNTAALALFTGNGYQPIACYAPGRDPAINRAFAKILLLAPVASP